MDLHAAIGKRIKKLRLQVGFSQAGLADRAATSTEYISRLERNRGAASVLLLQRIADALGVPLRDLFDFDSSAAVDIRSARAQRVASIVEGLDDDSADLLEGFVVKFGRHLRK